MPPASSAPVAALRNKRLLADVRAILKNFRQWPTAAKPESQFQTFIREQFVDVQEAADKERSRALRQQAKDFAIMLKNLDRQKDIALVLSGERAPPRELVKMAAARCGLSVPEMPELEGLTLEDGAKRGYMSLRSNAHSWRPDTSSEITKKYSKKVEKLLGKEEEKK